jgi:crossover junction endodeoxyribonuclease RuvC
MDMHIYAISSEKQKPAYLCIAMYVRNILSILPEKQPGGQCMIVMGIDPGFAITGYGVVDYTGNRFKVLDYGIIKTEPATLFPQRLLALHKEMGELMARHKPDVMAVEELFFNTNVTTGIKVGHARGVILLSAAIGGVPVFEYTPMQVKLAVVGYGNAKKPQVQQMVKVLLGLDAIPKPDDAADALAVAICQAHTGMLRARG